MMLSKPKEKFRGRQCVRWAHLSIAGLLFSAAAAYGQDGAFEVASVRPAPPPTGNGISRHSQGGPGSKDPGRIHYENVTIRSLIMRAYNLKDYQVTGSDWISSEGYDITATLPPDSTKEQFAGMMRRLLAERFHLVSHR